MESQAAPRSQLTGFSRPKATLRPEGSKTAQSKELAGEIDRLMKKTEGIPSEGGPIASKKDRTSTESSQGTSTPKKEDEPFDQDKVIITYEERVKEFGLTPDEAMTIVDQITMEGFYAETFKVSKDVSVQLHTRPTRFNTYLTDKIDLFDPKKVGRMNQLMSESQLAASISRYGDTEFQPLTDALAEEQWGGVMENRLNFIRSLPTPLFVALCSQLAKFDLKLSTIFSEGYEAYF